MTDAGPSGEVIVYQRDGGMPALDQAATHKGVLLVRRDRTVREIRTARLALATCQDFRQVGGERSRDAARVKAEGGYAEFRPGVGGHPSDVQATHLETVMNAQRALEGK